MKSSLVSAAALTFAAAFVMGATTEAASARGWHGSGTFVGPHRTVHTSSSVTRGGGMASGYHSVQGSYGHGYTSSFNRSCGSGTCTRNSTLQTNSGNTWTRSGSVTNNHDGSVSYDRVTTGPNGNEVTRSGTVTNTPQ